MCLEIKLCIFFKIYYFIGQIQISLFKKIPDRSNSDYDPIQNLKLTDTEDRITKSKLFLSSDRNLKADSK